MEDDLSRYYYAIKIFLLIPLVIALIKFDLFSIINLSFALGGIFILERLKKRSVIEYPRYLEVLTIIFLLCSIILGNLRGFYTAFWWWDLMLHFVSGIILSLIAVLMIYLLNGKNNNLNIHAGLGAFFSLTFAMFFGAVWEIYEFLMDFFFDMNNMRSGLNDTMTDLISMLIGSAIIAISFYFFLKKKENKLSDIFIKPLIKMNKKLCKSS